MQIHHPLPSLIIAALLLSATTVLAEAPETQPETKFNVANTHAEPPHWPVGFQWPAEYTKDWKKPGRLKKPKAHVLVWTPPKAKKLRGVFLIPANTDSKHIGEHKAVRDVFEKHEIGIVYLRNFAGQIIERTNPPQQPEQDFAAMLDMVAQVTGIDSYRHAPWIMMGKSSRGMFPYRTAWYFPEKTICTFTYHGETPKWPIADWAKPAVKTESILHLALNGQEEWSGTWYRHVRPFMLNYHHHTNWLTHQVVLWKVGHGDYWDRHGTKNFGKTVPEGHISTFRSWDYIALYLDKAISLRVPKDEYATAEKPVELKKVDRSKGYLIHPRAPEELLGMKWMAFRQSDDGQYKMIPWPDEKHPVHDTKDGDIKKELLIRKATDVPEDERADYFWVADLEQAKAWLDLHRDPGHAEGVLPDASAKANDSAPDAEWTRRMPCCPH